MNVLHLSSNSEQASSRTSMVKIWLFLVVSTGLPSLSPAAVERSESAKDFFKAAIISSFGGDI